MEDANPFFLHVYVAHCKLLLLFVDSDVAEDDDDESEVDVDDSAPFFSSLITTDLFVEGS
jgi:hypothetical protein